MKRLFLRIKRIRSGTEWYLLLLGLLLLGSCQPEFKKFTPPEWIEGKLFQQLQSIPGTETFQLCVRRTGYDTILNSANFTVFAPDNQAFEEYFSTNPTYASVDDIPEVKLHELVKRHIIQNPWSRDQLQSAYEEGWIDKNNPDHDKPWGYKRQTLLKEDNRKYWLEREPEGTYRIVDSSLSNEYLMVYQPSRKFVPFFFDEYMDIVGIGNSDFEFYFDRSYEPGSIYLGGAKLAAEDHFAENGFIYVLDRLVTPLRNVEQIMECGETEHNYNMFLDLIRLFPDFQFNEYQTWQQEGVEEGLGVERLYDLNYDELTFEIHEEITGDYTYDEKSTTRYHNGLLAPTNEALQEVIDRVITIGSGDSTRWPTFDMVPLHIKKTIVNSHMRSEPIYLMDMERGFVNGEWDSVFMDPSVVIEKKYASNASFLGINRAIIPRAFSSVTAPAYLRPQYQEFAKGLDMSGLAPALKRRYEQYSFYVVQVGDGYFDNWDQDRLLNRFMEQVGTRVPSEKSKKEFIPSMGGNFIVYDTTRRPNQLDNETDNGIAYASGWIWPKKRDLTWTIYNDVPVFFSLIKKAGMLDEIWWKFNFINFTDFHTIFAPTDNALSRVNTDSLSMDQLQQFIKYHFVSGDIIFTDGFKEAGKYNTLREDEESFTYDPQYSTLDIRPEYGSIGIFDQEGNPVCQVSENKWKSNLVFGRTDQTYKTMGVIHAIDTVLNYYPGK